MLDYHNICLKLFLIFHKSFRPTATALLDALRSLRLNILKTHHPHPTHHQMLVPSPPMTHVCQQVRDLGIVLCHPSPSSSLCNPFPSAIPLISNFTWNLHMAVKAIVQNTNMIISLPRPKHSSGFLCAKFKLCNLPPKACHDMSVLFISSFIHSSHLY